MLKKSFASLIQAPVLGVSRRRFVQGNAALVLGFVLPQTGIAAKLAANSTNYRREEGSVFKPNAFLSITPDNAVHIVANHSEMGQAIYTALAQLVADELDANWDDVVVEHVPFDPAYNHTQWGIIATGGSSSVASEWTRLRQVGASARAMLVEAAAQNWGIPAASLTTKNSMVIDTTNQRSIAYGELVAIAAMLPLPQQVTLKSPDQFNLIGTDVKRLEAKSKINGSAVFGIDFNAPGLLIAAVAHPPIFGATLKKLNDNTAKNMPGVHKVVRTTNGVAVIADTFWQAKKAKDALVIEWDDGDFAHVSSKQLWNEYRHMAEKPGIVFEKAGNTKESQGVRQIRGEFAFPFLEHTPMEPINATAQFKNGRMTLWAGTQFQTIDAMNIANKLDIAPVDIDINVLLLGGGFGRRAVPHSDYMVEAAEIAKASGLDNPIKMIWQREDDVRGGYYRPMVLHRYQMDLDDTGMPLNWEHVVVSQSIVSGTSFAPLMIHDGVDHSSVEGLAQCKYHVPNRNFSLHTPQSAVPVLWWRSVGHTHTAVAVENLINLAAKAAQQDPIAYRKKLLQNHKESNRLLNVLNVLEEKSRWKTPLENNVFHGVAVHESFGSVCGYVVAIKKAGKRLSLNKITAVIDCGVAVNPGNVKAQIFGAANFALSEIYDEITLNKGAAVQSNFHDYPIPRMVQGATVDVHLTNPGLDTPTGMGEPGVPPFIPALIAAISEATGQEITRMPLQLENGYTFG